MESASAMREPSGWEVAAEAITLRIRWFGVVVGYLLINLLPRAGSERPLINAILTLGAAYTLTDTWLSLKKQVMLGRYPLLISVMEAVFIGLLCYFDQGLESPFRFYYFLSLLVCAIRYSPVTTATTYLLHVVSCACLFFSSPARLVQAQATQPIDTIITNRLAVSCPWCRGLKNNHAQLTTCSR